MAAARPSLWPAPAPASILASKFTQIVWYTTSFDIFFLKVKNKLVTLYTNVTSYFGHFFSTSKNVEKPCSQEPEPELERKLEPAPGKYFSEPEQMPPENRTAPELCI